MSDEDVKATFACLWSLFPLSVLGFSGRKTSTLNSFSKDSHQKARRLEQENPN